MPGDTMTAVFASVFGLFLVAAGTGLMIERRSTMRMIEELRGNSALCFIFGVLTYAIGVVTVVLHNIWTDPAAIVVSLIGWSALVKGVLFIVLRSRHLELMAGLRFFGPTVTGIGGAIGVLLGAWLIYAGFTG